ncbi:unnamed protein product [Lasius platythorax]|uniref:Uncharacterized protein n=1 Tax=Lasius platythorax TaxID=488582 RepID=A0AAV2P5P8_9HYME
MFALLEQNAEDDDTRVRDVFQRGKKCPATSQEVARIVRLCGTLSHVTSCNVMLRYMRTTLTSATPHN